MPGNLLANETSPYLLQHSDNPVHWRPWGPEALAEARAENKPILLSVGYAACHWCHVMAHESFEDEETAALMNEQFVNVKVDREERPDIDAIYQNALALLGEHGGWPLTMFLTPDGEPFWGGTYFPPAPRFGRPAFRDVLKAVREVYDHEQDKVAHNAAALRDALKALSQPKAGETIAPDFLPRAAARLVQEVDPVHGGLGHAPKFPQVPLFEMMWRGWKQTGNAPLADAVTRTLDHMSLGGIYDHLGGGFARYATDPAWLVPHFEKMLYDNAQLVDLFTLVWPATRSALYAARVEETIAWVLRDMTVADAAFASSFDADSEGKEGTFYTWTADEIDRLLGDDAPLFKEAYGITADGNWEGVNILNRRAPPDPDSKTEARLTHCREILWRAREDRPKPLRDDKVLADWNGLMIRALANAGAVFARPDWIEAAQRAFTFVRDHMEEDGRLHHSWRAGRASHTGTLDDYAAMARAATALYEASGDNGYLLLAERWLDTADRHFWDETAGGYFFTADDAEGLITRTKTAVDAAAPSGNAMMTETLARLYHLTGRDPYRERAEAVVAAFAGEVPSRFFVMSALINAHALLNKALEIVIVGPRGAVGTDALVQAVHAASLPDRVLARLEPGASLPRGHPAHGKDQAGGRPTAYVCRQGTCSAPVTDPVALKEHLAQA